MIEFLLFLIAFLNFFFLFPIKDRRDRQRGFPWATVTLITVNVLIHMTVTIIVAITSEESELSYEVTHFSLLYPFMSTANLIVNGEGLGALSVLTSGFLHGDTRHLLGNMFFLWFFGRKVEDSTGPVRFILFYLLCLFTADFISTVANVSLSNFHAQLPGLGASGAIAGLMAAYLFLYSEERVLTLFSVWIAPLIPLPVPGGCLIPTPAPVWLPAWVFIVYQFLGDALQGQLIQEVTQAGVPISFGVGVFAHLGGAAAGLLFIFLFLHPDVLAQRR